MAIGRPISLTPNIATKNISSLATADQTEFTVTGGYRINEIAVYRNGVRLAEGRDFTASDGDTVNLVTAATASDVIEFAVFDSFNVSDAIVSAASSQNLNGDFNVTGKLYAGTFEPGQLVAGIATASTALHVGSALTANAAGDVESIGIITAASFSGDGSALTGLANTDFVVSVATTTGNLNVSAAATITGAIDSNATTDSTSSTTGAITAAGGVGIAKDLFVGDAIDVTKDLKVGAAATITGALSAGAISGSTGTFSGAVNIDDTTDSTSATSGSLIVDGGLGVAKNVYIGAGLSVAGTLTYEDVTNVDSVGLITAKSGVNVSGGQVTIGTGITMGIAGVATFSGTSDVHLVDNVRLNIGDGSDLAIYNDGTRNLIDSQSTQLRIETDALRLRSDGGDTYLEADADGAVKIYYDNNLKFETTDTGVKISDAILEIADTSCLIDLMETSATNHRIRNGSGNFYVQKISDDKGTTTDQLKIDGGTGSVELYHNGEKRFETFANGIVVRGGEGADGEIQLYADEGDDNADYWRAKADTSGTFGIDSYSTGSWSNKLSLTTAGALTATSFIGDGSSLTGVGGDMDITSCLFV